MSNSKLLFKNINKINISKILELYNNYRFYYLEEYKKQILDEYSAIKKEFPNVEFRSKFRIKSYDSTLEKAYERPIEDAYDIHAGRHIIKSVDSVEDEALLIDYCYRVRKFLLDDYYINNSIYSIEDRMKDYIQNPKPNGYQALHLSCECENRKFETQIKTEKMEEDAKSGRASHAGNYKTRFIGKYAKTRLPYYLIPKTLENGEIILEVPSFEENFLHYYGMTYKEYLKMYRNR